MFYQYYSPAPELQKYIHRYHMLEMNNENLNIYGTSWARQHLMFNYGDSFTVTCPDGFTMSTLDCFINGSLTRPIVFNANKINIKFILVEFHSMVIRSLLREDAHQLTDIVVDLFDIFPNEKPWVIDALKEAKTPRERINYVDSFLKNIFSSAEVKAPSYLVQFVSETERLAQPMYVFKKCCSSGKSKRQWRRSFQNYLGVSPMQFARYSRVIFLQKEILNSNQTSLADLAYKYQFADQAHMIKEFKALTSFTPKAFAKRRPFTIGQML